jgi:hypothetical protein
MPSDILIIPNRSSTSTAPVIQFSGSAANNIRLEVLASGSIAFLGNSGSLFSIADVLTGSLFAVNDISGLPILEVFSDDRVIMGRFASNTLVVTGSNVSIGKATQNAKLDVNGSAAITGSASVTVSLGVGVVASGTAGEIRATGEIISSYSDDRLKTKLGSITDAIEKIKSLNGFYYVPSDMAMVLGYPKKIDVGISAQEVNKILPEIISPAPINPQYMTVRYERLIPLLIEAIKEQQNQIEKLKKQVETLDKK